MMMMCNLIQFQVVVRGSQRQGVNFHLLLFVCLYILPYTHYKIITSGCEYLMLRKMLFCNPQKKVSRSSLRKQRTADGKILDFCPRHCKSTIRAPNIGQALPFGQSQSDRDVFRLRLASALGQYVIA